MFIVVSFRRAPVRYWLELGLPSGCKVASPVWRRRSGEMGPVLEPVLPNPGYPNHRNVEV